MQTLAEVYGGWEYEPVDFPCPLCGHTRWMQGHPYLFRCSNCGHQVDSDTDRWGRPA